MIPAILPEFAGGIRNIIGLIWAFSLGAEYLSSRSGIGYLLYQSYLYADMGKLLIISWLYILLGVCSYLLFKSLIQSKTKWLNTFYK